MASAHFVKAARKDNSVVKKGESYYWWQLYRQSKRYSVTPPKRSQLTGSSFLSQMYDIEDDQIGKLKAEDADDLRSQAEDIASQLRELGEECEENLGNMPEGLQEGVIPDRCFRSGSMYVRRWLVNWRALIFDDYEAGSKETLEEWLQGKVDELQGICYGGP